MPVTTTYILHRPVASRDAIAEGQGFDLAVLADGRLQVTKYGEPSRRWTVPANGYTVMEVGDLTKAPAPKSKTAKSE